MSGKCEAGCHKQINGLQEQLDTALKMIADALREDGPPMSEWAMNATAFLGCHGINAGDRRERATESHPKFVSLCPDREGRVLALDETGRVWRYYPAATLKLGDKPIRFAFWGRLTDHRGNPTPSKKAKS